MNLQDMTNRELIRGMRERANPGVDHDPPHANCSMCFSLELARRLEEQGTPDGYELDYQDGDPGDSLIGRQYVRVRRKPWRTGYESIEGHFVVRRDGQWRANFDISEDAVAFVEMMNEREASS